MQLGGETRTEILRLDKPADLDLRFLVKRVEGGFDPRLNAFPIENPEIRSLVFGTAVVYPSGLGFRKLTCITPTSELSPALTIVWILISPSVC